MSTLGTRRGASTHPHAIKAVAGLLFGIASCVALVNTSVAATDGQQLTVRTTGGEPVLDKIYEARRAHEGGGAISTAR